MNLNDFVVLPNKPKSVKLNPSRNMRELRMETVQLAQENATMESRLKQLRENMSREKEERERSGGIRWKSGQAGPLSGGPTARRNRDNAATSATATAAAAAMPKVPGAKVKIRVLKDEPLPELPRRPVERPSVAGGGEQMPSRRPQLKGRACGQCEAREAGLMCPECGEDYCIGCFAKFHQRGALKLHRMIPMQAAVQTSVSALEVVQRFQTQVGSDSPKLGSAPTGDRKRTGGASWRSGEASAPATHYPVPSGSHEAARPRTASDEEEDDEEEEDDLEEDDLEEEEMEGRNVSPPRGGSSLLQGSFDEEESARSFQQALQQWRRGGGGGGKEEEEEEAPGEEDGPADSQHTQQQQQQHRQQVCRPLSDAMPVSVEATGTQADFQPLQPVRPIHVEFKQQGITYMEKLLIKKHRRTPIEEYRPLSSEASSTPSTPSTVAQEPLTPSHSSETDGESHRLTEEEKEMRSYLLSLFAVTPCAGTRESPSPEPCISPLPLQPTMSMVELDQTVGDSAGTSAFGVERRQVNTKSREGLNESMMKCEREKKRDMVGSAGSSASKLCLSPGGQPPSPSGKWPVAPAPPPRPNPRPSPPSPGPPRANSQHPSPPPPSSVQSSSSSSSSSLSPSGQLPAKASGGRLSRTPKSDKIKTSSSVEDGMSAKTRLKESPSKTPSPRSRLTTITPPGSSESLSANPQLAPKTPSPRSMLTPSPRLGTSKTGLTPSPPPLPRPPSADHHHQSPTPSSLELRSTNSRKRFQAPSPRGTLTPSPRLGSSKDLLTPSPPPAHVTTAAPPHTSSPSEIQSTDPLYTPSPSRLSSPGLRRPVEASTPVSSMEMTPETSMTETVSFRLLPRDSSSPQHAPVVPPLNITSTPPSAEHSTLSSHKQNSALARDSDCGLEEEEDDEREEEKEDEREEEDWRGSVGLLLDQSDSSDEERRRCEDGQEESILSSPPPPPPSCPPDGPQCSGRSVEEGPSTPATRTPDHESTSRLDESSLFTQPSSALLALAQRQPVQPHSYLGLDGFLTLGVEGTSARQSSTLLEATSARQGSAPVSTSTHELYSGAQHLSWRPGSSLRESAPEELVMAVLDTQSPRGATRSSSSSSSSSRPASSSTAHSRPTTPASATHRLLAAGRCTPRSPRGPTSVSSCPVSRPTSHSSSRPASHSASRPMSRAAQEIEEVQSVEREVLLGGGDLQEEEEEQEDRQALASLEEEFRRLSTAQPGTSGDLGSSGVPTSVARGTAVGHRSSAGRSWSGGGSSSNSSGSSSSSRVARQQRSGGHPDEAEEEEEEEEEERLRDKQSVLALH